MQPITTLEQFWDLFPSFAASNTSNRLTLTAELLGYSVSAVRDWQRQGLLPKSEQISLENLMASLEAARLLSAHARSKGLPWPAILSFLENQQQ